MTTSLHAFRRCVKVRKTTASTDLPTQEWVSADVTTTADIRAWPADRQEAFRAELGHLLPQGFPTMPEAEWRDYLEDYFRLPAAYCTRQVVIFRNETSTLIGAALFDYGTVLYETQPLQGAYVVMRVFLPEYQGAGLGQLIAAKILMELQPDVLLVNCYQSSSLYSWITLPQKGVITGYDVYPRIERHHGQEQVLTVPLEMVDFAVTMFRQLYLSYIVSPEIVEQEVRKLTRLMVRKETHGAVYDFHPWEKDGRPDRVATALGVGPTDGILVVFKKK